MLKRVTAWLHRRNDFEICAMLIDLVVGSAVIVSFIFTGGF